MSRYLCAHPSLIDSRLDTVVVHSCYVCEIKINCAWIYTVLYIRTRQIIVTNILFFHIVNNIISFKNESFGSNVVFSVAVVTALVSLIILPTDWLQKLMAIITE